ncbi:hypothetical protein PPYR_11093 [Photinus pyralis]|uniref:Cytochrome P450 n=2 Tax=Photinus pyralis TaxID=7054 RepID=A0A5N4AI59_PHOPY|nr:probable cytochrome P450 49a1 [Photinus pyralis]XP_031347568.1 probable cytochrome P450 49a1 [Photinus pyralis]KAB0797032.1 hypothetical protein PPYR_11093 [Photinus pyralis]
MTRRAVWKVISRRYYSTDRPFSTVVLPEMLEDYQRETVEKTIPKSYSEVPGPRSLPIVGNTWRFAPVIGQYQISDLDKLMWSLFETYGKIVKVSGLIGHPDLLFVYDGDEIKKVFRGEEEMPRRPSMPSLHYYKEILRKDFFDGNAGVIGIHGPKWDEFRKQVQQIVLPPSTARKYIQPLNVIAGEFLERMEESLDENKELPDKFLYEIYKWALESVARVSLDTRLGCLDRNLNENSESQRIINSINTFFWNVSEVELKMPIWRFYKNKAFTKYIGALEDFRTLCMKYITRTVENISSRSAIDKQEEDISIVERIFLKTGNSKVAAVLALDLLLVGVDTTSIALASTLYQLSQNQDKQQKVYEELCSILPEAGSAIDSNAQENLHYLKACIKETLRMYPVIIGNGRSLSNDTVIGGYMVPKGTHIIFPHLVVSNIEEYFDQPHKFVPERWLKTEMTGCPIQHKKIHPFVTLPFGYGRRACLGRRFAEMELQILLAKIFRKYKVEYNYGPLTYEITPTYVPKEPLKFKLTLR